MILAGALIALMAVGAFAQTYTAESNFQVTKTATAVTISKFVGGPAISEVIIPPTIQNLPVTAIGNGVFSGNTVTSITIPASVTSIGMTACYALPMIKSVTFLGTIPTAGFINSAFAGDLRVKFYATDKNNGTPGTYTRNVETWTLTPATTTTTTTTAETPATNFDYSTTADKKGIIINAYEGTATAVRIPDRINNLPVVEIGNDAFNGVKIRLLLTSIVIPNTVTTIGNYAFSNQDQLPSITLPTSLATIGNNAFYQCFSLTSISLPASVKTIGGSAFRDCNSLTTVTIPASVTKITFGNNVFQGATSVNAASKTALQKVGYTGNF
jgi:hypothetical protein